LGLAAGTSGSSCLKKITKPEGEVRIRHLKKRKWKINPFLLMGHALPGEKEGKTAGQMGESKKN